MKFLVTGEVVAVEPRSYVSKEKGTVNVVDVFLKADNPRFRPDRITAPADIAPQVGDAVSYDCSVRAKSGQHGAYLSVWAFAVSA